MNSFITDHQKLLQVGLERTIFGLTILRLINLDNHHNNNVDGFVNYEYFFLYVNKNLFSLSILEN